MQSSLTDTQQTIAALLEAMEAEAIRNPPKDCDQRAESRRPLHAECDLCLFQGDGDPCIVQNAVARNLTFLGLSVVAPLFSPLRPGRPVEAIIKVPDHTNTHVAGTVAFCRQVDEDCHELGISVKAAGPTSILMHDVAASIRIYDWFATAMKTPE